LTDNAQTINNLDDFSNPMVRMFALGKVCKMLRGFAVKDEITRTGRMLLKGFYTTNKFELEGGLEDGRVDFGNADWNKARSIIK